MSDNPFDQFDAPKQPTWGMRKANPFDEFDEVAPAPKDNLKAAAGYVPPSDIMPEYDLDTGKVLRATPFAPLGSKPEPPPSLSPRGRRELGDLIGVPYEAPTQGNRMVESLLSSVVRLGSIGAGAIRMPATIIEALGNTLGIDADALPAASAMRRVLSAPARAMDDVSRDMENTRYGANPVTIDSAIQALDPLENAKRARAAAEFGDGAGYTPLGLGERIGTLGSFAAHGIAGSLGDMAGAIAAPLPYMVGYADKTTRERARNDQRDIGITDVGIGAANAVVQTVAERFATARLFPGATARITPGIAAALGRTAKETGVQAGTEFGQESIDYLSTHLGTEKGATLEDTLKAGTAGALIGGPLGAGAQGAKELLNPLPNHIPRPTQAPNAAPREVNIVGGVPATPQDMASDAATVEAFRARQPLGVPAEPVDDLDAMLLRNMPPEAAPVDDGVLQPEVIEALNEALGIAPDPDAAWRRPESAASSPIAPLPAEAAAPQILSPLGEANGLLPQRPELAPLGGDSPAADVAGVRPDQAGSSPVQAAGLPASPAPSPAAGADAVVGAQAEPVAPAGKLYQRGNGKANSSAQALQLLDGTWRIRNRKAKVWQPWRKPTDKDGNPIDTFDPSPAFGYRETAMVGGSVTIPGVGRVPVQKMDKAPTSGPDYNPLLDLIAQAGGISKADARRFGVDPAAMNTRRGIKPLFSDKGIPLDTLREKLIEDGYLPPEPENAPPIYDLNDIWEVIAPALNGTPVGPMGDPRMMEMAEQRNAEAYGPQDETTDADTAPDPDEALAAWYGDLETETGDDIAPGDEATAASLFDIVSAALDSGVSSDAIIRSQSESLGAYSVRLRALTQEATNGTEQETGGLGNSAGNLGPQGREAEPVQDFELGQAAAPQAEPARQVAPAGGLFGAPSSRDFIDSAQRAKDASRDGRTGTGRTDMLAGDGALFAGRAPEQESLESVEDQTDTPEFKRWFGDSAVVDADGKPITLYHGTAKRFSKINMRKGAQGLFWMTSDREAIERGEVGAAGNGTIMPLFAKITKPAGWAEYDRYGIGELKRDGYDGLILQDSDGSMTVAAFAPDQIKSADRNNGNFDPGNLSILQSAEEVADADLTPNERQSLDRQSTDRKALRAKLSQEQGERDADNLGLRAAVDAVLGDAGLTVNYLRGYEGLPSYMLQDAERAAAKRGGKFRTAGLFNPRTREVFLFTDVANTPDLAAFTAAHEVAGHKGLRALLGDKLDKVLDLAVQNPTVKAVADAMYRNRKMADDVKSGKKTERQARLLSVEEALADLAAAVRTQNWDKINTKHGVEVPAAMRSRLRAMIDNILARIRALFGKQGVAFSDAQVRELLEDAWQAAQQGGTISTPENALESVEPSREGNQGVEFANGQETLTSRLAQWVASLQVGGGVPRTVDARPESIGSVNRGADNGAAEQGNASREEIREQSRRLIERAKAEGFFWGEDSPILFALGRLFSNGGAEHEVYAVGRGIDRIVIRATDNGNFGPISSISPAQYLARLDDYSRTFPSLQTRLIGVSESSDVRGHAVIWTAQEFVYGRRFETQSLLVEAMEARGWETVDGPYSYKFRHKETGAVIADVHAENLYYDDNGDLYPFDVVVTQMPRASDSILESVEEFDLEAPGPTRRSDGRIQQARANASGRRAAVNSSLGNPADGGALGWNPVTSEWAGTRGTLREVRENMQDKMIVLRDVQQDIEAARGEALPDEQNVYRLENLMYGRVGKGMETLDATMFDPLFKAMRQSKVKPEALEDFLYARHAQERNANLREANPDMVAGSGMADAEAQAILDRAGPELAALANRIDRITSDTRARLLDAGIITQAQFNAMQAQFQHFVPLRGKAEADALDTAARSGGLGGAGLEVRGSGIKSMMGRNTRAQNILGEVIGDAQRSIIAAEKARVGRALARLVLANPNPSFWTMEPVRTERKKDPVTGEVYEAILNESASPDVVHIRVRGVQYRIQFANVKVADALKNVGAENMVRWLRPMQTLNRYVSATLTSYNPGFIAVNLTRDAVFGLTRILAEHGVVMHAKVVAAYPGALKALSKAAVGKPESARLEEFTGAGGKTGWVTQAAVDTLQEKVRLDTKTGAFGNSVRAAKAIASVVEEANSVVENAMRLAYFSALRDSGMSVDKAAEKAKDLTVNFNRQGKLGPLLKIAYLFYNPGVQGAHQVIKALKNPKMQGALVALGAAQFALAMLAAGMEDEDGEPLSKQVPDFVKERNLWMVWPGEDGKPARILTLPMPYGFNVFTYIGGRTAQLMSTDASAMAANTTTARQVTADFVGGVGKSVLQAFSPIPIDEGMTGLIPTIPGKAILELATGKDGLGRRFRSENPFDKTTPKAMQGKADTHEVFKATAAGLNWIGMGDEYHKPLAPLDWAPEDIEYMYGLATGGAGRTLLDMLVTGHDIATTQDRSQKPTPIVKSFTRPINEASALQAGFYERKDTITVDADRIRDIAEAEGVEAAREAAAAYPHLRGVAITLDKKGEAEIKPGMSPVYGSYKAAEKATDEARRKTKALYGEFGTGLSAGRSEQMRAVRTERAEAQRVFIRAWNTAADEFAEAQ